MKLKKRALALILTVLMALSCFSVVPMVANAEGAPTIDGVKDAAYTADKMIKVNTAFDDAGNGIAKENADGMYMEVYYTWDSEYVYILMDITDPSATQGVDCMAIVNNKDISHGFIALDPKGSLHKYDAAGNVPEGYGTAPAEMKVVRASDSNNRTYEFKYALNGNTEGFRISPMAGNGSYGICYNGTYGQGAGAKQILFNDESTWYGEALKKEVADDATIDGEKDDRYTDDRKAFISTAFTGDHGMEVENKSGMTYTIWTAWDDEYNYIYAEADDPNATCTYDLFYFKNNMNEFQGLIFAQTGAGYVEYDNGAVKSSAGPVVKSVIKAETGKRKFEFKFERKAGAEGIQFGIVGTPTGGYVVAHGNDYNTTDFIAVSYTDESTWLQEFVPGQGGDGEDPGPVDPGPVTPPPSADGLDAIKDDRYDEERCTTMSVAYAGSGGGRITNSLHIYIKLYYAWDDAYNYVYWEVHDPFNTQGYDVLYYITNTLSASGQMFAVYDGGYLQFNAADGALSGSLDAGGREIKYATNISDGLRTYEAVLPKTDGAIGMQLSPVFVRSDFTFSVSYDTNYYMLPNKNINYENAAGHWTDDSCVDGDVMMDPAKLEAAKAELAKIPADISTLTYEDKGLIDSIKAVMDTIPASWAVFFDQEQYNRYFDAVARINELEAAAREAELKAIEERIAALPEKVTVDDLETLEEIKADLDALGAIADYLDAALKAAFTEKLGYLNGLLAPVKVDGKKDPIYDKDSAWPISGGFPLASQSDMATNDPPTYGTLYTAADENYFYIYVEMFDGTGIVDVPEGVNYNPAMWGQYDSIYTIVDPDPQNVQFGTVYKDIDGVNDAIFAFHMLADGTIIDTNSKMAFLHEAGNIAPFRNGNTYGYEMRVARIEGEESFKINLVVADPVYVDGALDSSSLQIALGKEWAYNYIEYGEKFFEDYPTFFNYGEVLEMIDALPDPATITNKDAEKKAKRAKDALALLNEDQMAFITEEAIAKLNAVIDAIANVVEKPDCVYGDVNGDGNINAEDALWVLQAAVSKRTLDDAQTVAADVDGSGALDAVDALMILQKAVNKIDKFPVEE